MVSYSGIGSRYISPQMKEDMISIGCLLGSLNVNLRSGAADGSDKAFEYGCDLVKGPKEIFLPWRGFDNHPSELWQIPDIAYDIARQHYHLNWSKTKDTTKRFMARDCMQVSGIALDDFVEFVVCYTRDGCEHADARTTTTGGTGQAIAYASRYDIPVFNLHNEGRYNELLEYIVNRYGNGI